MTSLENSDELKCDECKRYLSFPPVFVKMNGKSICCGCNNKDEQLRIRNLTYEAIAKTHRFPCDFKDAGCTETSAWEQSKQHEITCIYRNWKCFKNHCRWNGSLFNIEKHYRDCHPELLFTTPMEIQPDSLKNKKINDYVVSAFNCTFIVRLIMVLSTTDLVCVVYFVGDPKYASYFKSVLSMSTDKVNVSVNCEVSSLTAYASPGSPSDSAYINTTTVLTSLRMHKEKCKFNVLISLKQSSCLLCKSTLLTVNFYNNGCYCDNCLHKNDFIAHAKKIKLELNVDK